MADGFIWYELVTNDIDEAVKFYGKVVGWDFKDSGMPGMKYVLFGKEGRDVGGIMSWAQAGASGMDPQWMGHIHTAKLDDEVAAVVADGGQVVKPVTDIPGVGRFAVVLDPQGVKYLLFEPGSRDVPPRLGQMALGNVGWHELLTGDMEKAFHFYSKHYGWTKDYVHDMGPMGLYQTFKTDQPLYSGGMMSIEKPGVPEGIPRHWKFYFTVEHVDAAVKVIEDAGGKIMMPPMNVPGGSRVMQAMDPQGGHFALMQGPQN